jgi:inhibitor of KinA sporulation pathway (predicted exonuclease)
MAQPPWKSPGLDQILIVDVESTCWEGPPPIGQESEIIEKGLCLLEVASGRRQGKRNLLVRPERSTVSAFCTQLIGLTQEQVNAGISFADACALLQQEYASHECVWASYGDYDRLQFERQCQDGAPPGGGINVPFTIDINIPGKIAAISDVHAPRIS